ncbi:hypothetical protein F2981_05565 [Sinorhizobium meliloti]|nr:hypothetical protein [Sinorhizobium meliloti]
MHAAPRAGSGLRATVLFRSPVVLLSAARRQYRSPAKVTGRGTQQRFLLSLRARHRRIAVSMRLPPDHRRIDGSGGQCRRLCDGRKRRPDAAAGADPRLTSRAMTPGRPFGAQGDLFVPGPTGTNVNDLRPS